MRDGLRIVDSDAHVIEPHSLWTEYLDPSLREAAPRPVGLTFGFEFEDFSINLPRQWSPDATPDELEHMSARIQSTYAELFPEAYAKGFSADAQLVDMDREGIDRAFLYPSFGLFVLATDEIEPRLAVGLARAYNDWLADFVATDPARLFGTAMLPL